MKRRKRKQKFKRYAKMFCEQVRTDFKALSVEDPVIHFYPYAIYTDDIGVDVPLEREEDNLIPVAGFCNYTDNCIEIYDFVRRSSADVKETIRHECLHYLLWKNGLPHEDTDTLFLFMAVKYYATPYAILNPEIQTKMDNFYNAVEAYAQKGGEAWK